MRLPPTVAQRAPRSGARIQPASAAAHAPTISCTAATAKNAQTYSRTGAISAYVGSASASPSGFANAMTESANAVKLVTTITPNSSRRRPSPVRLSARSRADWGSAMGDAIDMAGLRAVDGAVRPTVRAPVPAVIAASTGLGIGAGTDFHPA